MKRLSLLSLAMVTLIAATGLSPSATAYPLPGTAPCGSYSSSATRVAAHKVLESGESVWFGFSGVQNLRMIGYLAPVSLENPADGAGGYLDWGIYNGETGSLVHWGWVDNDNHNLIDADGWFFGHTGAPTFAYNKVCVLIYNGNANEVISASYAFAIYVD